MGMDFERVIGEIAGFLESEKLPFLLIGGLAMHAHGLSRMTSDIDLLAPAASRERIIEFMEQKGYETLHASEGYSNHLHSETRLGRVDLVYVDEATLNKMLESASKSITVGEREIAVPCAEHLVAMKVLAMKNDPRRTLGEMVDIQHLMSLPETDLDQVRQYFEKHGLLRRYEDIRELPS
jgi:hypothetical protein